MSLRKALAPLALVVGLVAASAATAAPPAHIAGGDAGPPTYPSLVNVRLVQAQKALDRAFDYQGNGETDKAAVALRNARTAMTKAWTGAKYYIEHAPPPPVAGDDGVAIITGGAVGGASPYASPQDTAFAVFSVQHQVETTAMGMIDTASGALLNSVSTSIFAAMNARDAAIKYIHAIPAPPVAGDDSVDAKASGGAIASTWATVMPNLVFQLDDELQQIDAMGTLSAGKRRVLNAAELQATRTEKNVNAWWPPAPVGD
jgi:hypothetical protein